MGFETGKTYRLKSSVFKDMIRVDSDEGLYCYYSSIESFLNNFTPAATATKTADLLKSMEVGHD